MSTPNPNAWEGSASAPDWTPAHVDDLRARREDRGKWTVRRAIDDLGPGESDAPCCGRRDVDHAEMDWITPPLRESLEAVPDWVLRDRMGIDPSLDYAYICGSCEKKLRWKWRALDRRCVLDRAALAHALGAPPEAVEACRRKRDLHHGHGRVPEPKGGVALEVVERRGFTDRAARAEDMPPVRPWGRENGGLDGSTDRTRPAETGGN